MDIFRFTNPTAPTKMEQGELINGIKTKMWIERYNEAGEFTFTAPVSSGLRESLPIGSFISHVNTQEIMIVENHEINDQEDAESIITVTGRGYETYLENRIIGQNKTFPVTDSPDRQYVLDADYTWDQAIKMLRFHIKDTHLLDDNYALPYLNLLSVVSGTSASEIRTIERGTVYQRLLELLSIDNLGIKVIRPGPWSPTPASPNTTFVIHTGVDRTAEVAFSYDSGEIVNADYFWSNRHLKNAAYVTSKWLEIMVDPPEPELVNYYRRVMHVDASDLDDHLDAAPSGDDLLVYQAWLQRRGRDALASQIDINLTKAEVSPNALRSVYRVDFDVGDLISVSGGYNESSIMRVGEYVEIENETGESGYPTLVLE